MHTLEQHTAPHAPHAPPRRWRRPPATLLALVATLLILLFAMVLSAIPGLMSQLNKNKGAASTPQATPASLNLSGFFLNSISMVSPDEGWAVGNTSPYYHSF